VPTWRYFHGETIPNNFSKPKWGHHPDWVAVEIMQELVVL
jgi:hypothetical protein